MESPAITKKLWRMFQVVYYMLRKSMSKSKLTMDLQLLLKRGKIARKALRNLMTFHSHHHHHCTTTSNAASVSASSNLSRRSMDHPTLLYSTHEVEFSCSSTPSNHRDFDHEAAAAIARAFEILNSEVSDAESSIAPSPLRTPMWKRIGKSPAAVRQLRITDSPFPIKEDEVTDCEVDKEAEEFIKRFYEQLKRQQSIGPATPDCRNLRRGC